MATATLVPGSIVHEVLNQENYEQWSFHAKAYLLAKDLWDIVESPTQENGDGVALHAIQISCETDIFTFIKNINDAKDAWDTLAEKFCSELKILATPGPFVETGGQTTPNPITAAFC
ncbi:unnamed protein product [Prunus armeniaca]|uniref:DUF4219 domain-containing protein n=1 Tax=Prunus armeniaca TaxID=36596 RepID=A0A6J5WWV1_PRUAR|nr:unnamed protein product [Prunus armeniaca]